jgi:hypothetical protein
MALYIKVDTEPPEHKSVDDRVKTAGKKKVLSFGESVILRLTVIRSMSVAHSLEWSQSDTSS